MDLFLIFVNNYFEKRLFIHILKLKLWWKYGQQQNLHGIRHLILFSQFHLIDLKYSLTFAPHCLTRCLLRNKNCNSKDVRKSRSFLEESINFLIQWYTLLMITYFQITNERLIKLANDGLAVIELEV